VSDRPEGPSLLGARALSVSYQRRRLFRPAPPPAIAGIDLSVRRGEILGVVGESGSGKSSIARALTGLAAWQGEIELRDRRIASRAAMGRDYRRAVQIVFQHPDSSLNPRQTVADILRRPLRLFGGDVAAVPQLLEQVRLPKSFAARYPHQLSGGEKQRVAIARAFAARPDLIICDEITAPLDVSVQASVVDLLLKLRETHGTAYLFITHDLNLVRQVAHRIAVVRQGAIVDLLDIDDLRAGRMHPYTRELIAASPAPVGTA
jgi:peptide/nickel transport system ATP-binding protein